MVWKNWQIERRALRIMLRRANIGHVTTAPMRNSHWNAPQKQGLATQKPSGVCQNSGLEGGRGVKAGGWGEGDDCTPTFAEVGGYRRPSGYTALRKLAEGLEGVRTRHSPPAATIGAPISVGAGRCRCRIECANCANPQVCEGPRQWPTTTCQKTHPCRAQGFHGLARTERRRSLAVFRSYNRTSQRPST